MAVQFNRQGLEDCLQSSQEGWQILYTLYPHAAWTINTTAVREVQKNPEIRKRKKKSNLGNPLLLHTFSRLLLSKSQKCKCFDWGERFWKTADRPDQSSVSFFFVLVESFQTIFTDHTDTLKARAEKCSISWVFTLCQVSDVLCRLFVYVLETERVIYS